MTVKTVRMVRDPACNPLPHSADVHPEMVADYRTGGYVLVDEAKFVVADAQVEMPLEAKKKAAKANPFG
jgi:hypothetical protein